MLVRLRFSRAEATWSKVLNRGRQALDDNGATALGVVLQPPGDACAVGHKGAPTNRRSFPEDGEKVFMVICRLGPYTAKRTSRGQRDGSRNVSSKSTKTTRSVLSYRPDQRPFHWQVTLTQRRDIGIRCVSVCVIRLTQ